MSRPSGSGAQIAPAPASARRGRRTQAERSAETKARLLDATLDCLVEHGYAGTSTTLIAERAGVSRGAQMHHFASKAELVSRALEHLAERRIEEVRRAGRTGQAGHGRTARALDLLWRSHLGSLFEAAAELWVAARTDSELRATLAEVESRVSTAILDMCREIFDPDVAARRDFPKLVALALNTMQGLAFMAAYSDPRQIERTWEFDRARLAELFEAT